MKKTYIIPSVNISRFKQESIMTASGDIDAYNAMTDNGGTYKINKNNVTVYDLELTL